MLVLVLTSACLVGARAVPIGSSDDVDLRAELRAEIADLRVAFREEKKAQDAIIGSLRARIAAQDEKIARLEPKEPKAALRTMAVSSTTATMDACPTDCTSQIVSAVQRAASEEVSKLAEEVEAIKIELAGALTASRRTGVEKMVTVDSCPTDCMGKIDRVKVEVGDNIDAIATIKTQIQSNNASTVASIQQLAAQTSKAISGISNKTNANLKAISGLSQRVSDNANHISANQKAISGLSQRVSDNVKHISANQKAISGLSQRVSDNAKHISAKKGLTGHTILTGSGTNFHINCPSGYIVLSCGFNLSGTRGTEKYIQAYPTSTSCNFYDYYGIHGYAICGRFS